MRLIRSLTGGCVLTVIVAWACATWAPQRYSSDPFPNPTNVPNTVDPDGIEGVHFISGGLGWTFMTHRGERTPNGGAFWDNPYGGVYFRLSGWPCPALYSRVEVIDSDHYSPPFVRHRWQLPAKEIIYRGIATNDLPQWMHAQPDQRLAILPRAGFLLDALLYAVVYWFCESVVARRLRKERPDPRGFQVVSL